MTINQLLNEKRYHVDVEFIKDPERTLNRVPERQNEAESGIRSFASAQRTQVGGTSSA